MRDEVTEATAKRGSYHHGDLRRGLLKVARDEIARHGAQAISLTSLARLAGVSQSAPYRHFADRKALLEAVAADAFAALTEALSGALAARAPSETMLKALARAYLGFGEANIELYRLMFASRLTPEAVSGSALDATASAALGLLERALSAEAGDNPDRLKRLVYRTWAQLHGLVMLKADGFIASPLTEYI